MNNKDIDNKKELNGLYEEVYEQYSFLHEGVAQFHEEEDEYNCREMLPAFFIDNCFVPMPPHNSSSYTHEQKVYDGHGSYVYKCDLH